MEINRCSENQHTVAYRYLFGIVCFFYRKMQRNQLAFTLILGMMAGFLHSSAQSDQGDRERILVLTLSNDFIFETDRYFSNGIELEYQSPKLEKSPINVLLISGKRMDKVLYRLTLTQHLFTPRDLFSLEVDLNDRPFSSYLLLGEKKVSVNRTKGLIFHSEIQVGILGRYSGGESIQNGIHEILPASKPTLGWQNQMAPDPALNYRFRIEKGMVRSSHFYLIPSVDLRAGIPYTDAGASIAFRIGKMDDYFKNLGQPGALFRQFYFVGAIGGKYVVYNATLQGGLFNSSPMALPRSSPWVGQIQTGIAYTQGRFGIDFMQYFITPEFKGGLTHKYGSLSLRYSF